MILAKLNGRRQKHHEGDGKDRGQTERDEHKDRIHGIAHDDQQQQDDPDRGIDPGFLEGLNDGVARSDSVRSKTEHAEKSAQGRVVRQGRQ